MIYRLFEEPVFPDPCEAEPDGLLAVGGDLSPVRLLTAYAHGIFPWYGPDSPILWWSTDPRLILEPQSLHVPASLRRVMNSGRFSFTLDRDFEAVVRSCAASPRPGQDGTWLTPEMISAYVRLHELGFAHSIEARPGGEPGGPLLGGLYGIALGRMFAGESMFYHKPDASKAALVALVGLLQKRGYDFLDCQQVTPHMQRFGATEVPRNRFLKRLNAALQHDTDQGPWTRWEGCL